jgi:hypothetical protein
MAQRTVNARQLEVLAWIGDGCPQEVMKSDTYKVTAAALRSRRLVTTGKKSGRWNAELTDAGRHFLEHTEYPEGHWGDDARVGGWRLRPASAPTTALRPADQMMADVAAAGGRLEVDSIDRAYWDNLVASATRHGKIPTGKVLTVQRGSSWEQEFLVIGDAPTWMSGEPTPVSVPARLRRPDAAIAALRDDARELTFVAPLRQRALRILNAIAGEAGQRGYAVRAPRPQDGRSRAEGHLEIVVRGQAFLLAVTEESNRIPHVLTGQERKDRERSQYSWAPKYDYRASGRLRIRVANGAPVHADKFSDTKTNPLEDRLGHLLLELELRTARDEEQAHAQQQAAESRRRRWEETRAAAEVQAIRAFRTQVLLDQVTDWKQARDVGDYIDAMTANLAHLDADDLPAARAWISWAAERLHGLNPLTSKRLRLPPDPEVTADMLQPHMQGMSPYGPH